MGQTNGAKNSHFTHQGQLKEPLGNGPVVWEHGIPGLAHWVLRRGGSRPTLVVTWRSLRILKVWQPWNLELKIKQSNRCYLKLNWWKIAKLKLGWGLIISLYHKCSITERCVNLKKKKKTTGTTLPAGQAKWAKLKKNTLRIKSCRDLHRRQVDHIKYQTLSALGSPTTNIYWALRSPGGSFVHIEYVNQLLGMRMTQWVFKEPWMLSKGYSTSVNLILKNHLLTWIHLYHRRVALGKRKFNWKFKKKKQTY